MNQGQYQQLIKDNEGLAKDIREAGFTHARYALVDGEFGIFLPGSEHIDLLHDMCLAGLFQTMYTERDTPST